MNSNPSCRARSGVAGKEERSSIASCKYFAPRARLASQLASLSRKQIVARLPRNAALASRSTLARSVLRTRSNRTRARSKRSAVRSSEQPNAGLADRLENCGFFSVAIQAREHASRSFAISIVLRFQQIYVGVGQRTKSIAPQLGSSVTVQPRQASFEVFYRLFEPNGGRLDRSQENAEIVCCRLLVVVQPKFPENRVGLSKSRSSARTRVVGTRMRESG